jgi:hypothetical protein
MEFCTQSPYCILDGFPDPVPIVEWPRLLRCNCRQEAAALPPSDMAPATLTVCSVPQICTAAVLAASAGLWQWFRRSLHCRCHTPLQRHFIQLGAPLEDPPAPLRSNAGCSKMACS